MLTWDQLEALCADKVLARWTSPPPAPGFKRRLLYMAADVHESISLRPWPDADGERPQRTAVRRQAMRALLNRYARGEGLNLGRDIKELGTRDVDASMRSFWEFRSQGPIHETRLFGFFARPAAFVALSFGSRAGMVDADFEAERASCQQAWDDIADQAMPLDEPWPVRLRSELESYLND